MYGYVKQPDGVLKPILLKGIKNIIVSGDSLNIIYFKSGTSPINVLKVDQVSYRDTGSMNVCDGTPVNGNYTLTGGDLVNGDIKLSFGSTGINILDIFTKWMNSILSGKVAATTDKTLNEFAPQLEIGYVFGNTGTIPTALAMPIAEGQTPCTTNLEVSQSKVVYIAWDLQVDITPPIHTQVFEILFNETDGTASFTPLNTGEYVLYQFIAPIPGLPDPEGTPEQAECTFDNVLALTMPENIEYAVSVIAGGITNLTTCEASIQASFRTWDTTAPGGVGVTGQQIKTKVYQTNGSCPGQENSLCPSVSNVVVGDLVNSWEYYVQQNGTTYFNSSDGYGVGRWFEEQPYEVVCGQQIISSEIQAGGPVMTPEILNADWRLNPTFGGSTAYPAKLVDGPEVFEFPEFGIQGVAMGVHKTTAGQIEILQFGEPFNPPLILDVPEIHVCNGIPVTLDNKWRLDETMLSKNTSKMYTEGSQGSGVPAPPFWDQQGTPRYWNNTQITPIPDYMWVTDKGLNIRPVNGVDGSRHGWNQIWNSDITNAMRTAGLIPPSTTGPAGPGNEYGDGPNELKSKVRLWWRNYIPMKGVYDDYTIYNPAEQSESGLPPMMSKGTFNSGPPFAPQTETYPQHLGLVPFILEETYQPFLDAGFTHRAFMVGSQGYQQTTYAGGPPENEAVIDNKFVAGMAVDQQGPQFGPGNPAVINKWRVLPNVKSGDSNCNAG